MYPGHVNGQLFNMNASKTCLTKKQSFEKQRVIVTDVRMTPNMHRIIPCGRNGTKTHKIYTPAVNGEKIWRMAWAAT